MVRGALRIGRRLCPSPKSARVGVSFRRRYPKRTRSGRNSLFNGRHGLRDVPQNDTQPEIDGERGQIPLVACSIPKDVAYATAVWTRQALARHIREHVGKAGFPALSRAAKATVHRILAAAAPSGEDQVFIFG